MHTTLILNFRKTWKNCYMRNLALRFYFNNHNYNLANSSLAKFPKQQLRHKGMRQILSVQCIKRSIKSMQVTNYSRNKINQSGC